jgi:hypothetical protein
MYEDSDIEVKEVETYASSKGGKTYSYPTLVMSALNECSRSGMEEMKEGYFNNKRDRVGNFVRVWVPDTRFKFLECIETLIMITKRDWDEEMEKKSIEIEKKTKKLFEEHCNYEKIYWTNLNAKVRKDKQEKGIVFLDGKLNENSFYYNEFINEKVKVMREYFTEISKCLKRIGDYQEEMFEA